MDEELLSYLVRKVGCVPEVVVLMDRINSFLLSLPDVVREFARSRVVGRLPRDVHYRKGGANVFVYFRPQKKSLKVEVPVDIASLDDEVIRVLGVKVDNGFSHQVVFNVSAGSDVDVLFRLLKDVSERF